ncbi:hypothetical protein [Ruegeria sp. PrR005]|uniref:Uncharacterized protein n=1 Tax=Ruegeria sp. PrR005 TaxID=2706882 RepID=A0A6B2NKE6_9RHOB|nr:hypothetical protein [Ruegeria sp. PrR005]NDW43670.1 hypothetical protein [Ruegeria sp. PrR005]
MVIENTTTTPAGATKIPEWNGRVDQNDPAAMIKFLSSMPNAKTITHDELGRIVEGAVTHAVLGTTQISMKDGILVVEQAALEGDWCYCIGGTHASYGNFAVFWSVRGPGNGPRPRSCFMFWDDEAVMLNPGYAA